MRVLHRSEDAAPAHSEIESASTSKAGEEREKGERKEREQKNKGRGMCRIQGEKLCVLLQEREESSFTCPPVRACSAHRG